MLLLPMLTGFGALAQPVANIQGLVINDKGRPIEFVGIGVLDHPDLATFTDERGAFTLTIPAGQEVTIGFTILGYEPVLQVVMASPGEIMTLTIVMSRTSRVLSTVTIEAPGRQTQVSVITLDPIKVEEIPLPSGNFEQILKSIGLGVGTSGGELSSQYSVRGGNFDENLVYVNDFEVYRPLLIRGGQQEGLSFVNPKLIRKLSFSSGGFEAKYGDKMSSVLDINYKRPDSTEATIELSPLGAALHVEGSNRNRKWLYLLGARQKSTRYLLSSLETKGAYRPSFYDLQSLIIHRFSSAWEMEWIVNVNQNRYRFFPENRITSIGTIDNVKELEVFFDGSEKDEFQTYMSGLSATYIGDSNRTRLKFLISAHRSLEAETFDILGDYFLYQVETNLGEEFGDRLYALGYGTYHDFARNYLVATLANAEHKGYRFTPRHLIEWGVKYQFEHINDQLNEWVRQDSALYSLPYDTTQVLVAEVLKTQLQLSSNRVMTFVQDTWVLHEDSSSFANLTYGARLHWWDANKEWVVSPRAQFSFKPSWQRKVVFKAAAGLYQQPPFYRELRDLQGILHPEVRAQKSFHAVIGSDYVFKLWGREFRFITEAYYKQLWDLIPYDVEDVKIRYMPEQTARGYAAGVDFRLNGDFVEDTESWVTLSFLRTREDIMGDFYTVYLDSAGNEVFPGTSAFENVTDTAQYEVGFVPRPTDQFVNLAILFTDYLPSNKNFKVHLNLVFGSTLPFSPPASARYRNSFRIPPYRRVDIGFSALLWDRERREQRPESFFRHFERIWASLEVFNLLGINNTVSHIWINDNNGTLYAFENHLTGRLLNLRVIAKL